MKKFFKIFLYISLGIIALLLAVGIFLMTPPGKRVVRDITVSYLEKKLNTKVAIADLNYRIPSYISLDGVLLIDKHNDTLFRMSELNVDIQMLRLLNNQLKLDDVSIKGLYANIYRTVPDTTFNYQFLVDAFASVDTSANTKEEDTSATALLYEVDNVDLKDIRFIFSDQSGGTYFDISLDTLNLKPKEIDPTKMLYAIDNLYIDKVRSSFRTFERILPEEPEDTSASSPLLLSADNLKLRDIQFHMMDEVDTFILNLKLGQLLASLNAFDMKSKHINLRLLHLDTTYNEIVIGRTSSPEKEKIQEKETDTTGWKVVADDIRIQGVHYKMNNNNHPRQGSGIDFNHLFASNINLIANNLYYTSDSISGSIDHISLREKSGFDLQEFRTVFAYHNKGAVLKDLYIKTPQTLLRDNISINYPSLAAFQQDMGSAYTTINLVQSQVGVNDILLFMPASSRSSLTPYAGQVLQLGGNINGYIRQLRLNNLFVKGLNNTELLLTGTINGLPEMERLYYDLNLNRINTTLSDIRPFIPKETLTQLNLPQQINISGTVQGNLLEYRPTNLRINTSDGNIVLNGVYNMTNASSPSYNLDFTTDNLNIGKILRQEGTLGVVSMNGKANGSGIDPKTMNASIIGNVRRFDYNNYSYTGVNLNADIARQLVNLTLQSNDPNANLDLVAQVDLSQSSPAVNSVITLNQLNPYRLGFVNDTLLLGGVIKLNFTSLDPDRPVGNIHWDRPFVYMNQQTIELDSIYVNSNPQNDRQDVYIDLAGMLEANLTGIVPLTKIGDAFISKLNNYYKITDSVNKNIGFYDFSIIATAKYHPLIATHVPSIKEFDTVGLITRVSTDTFDLNLDAPYFIYNAHRIDTLALRLNDEKNKTLDYTLFAAAYRQLPDGMILHNVTAQGDVRSDSIITNISATDSNGVEQYAINASAFSYNDIFYATLLPRLRLYYDVWNVRPDNQVAFGSSGFYIDNLELFNNEERIKVNSEQPSTFNSPLRVLIDKFRLSNVTKIISNEGELVADGILHTDARIDLSDSFPKINADLSIMNLTAYNTLIGKLQGRVDNQNSNTYHAVVDILENENNINLSGQYHLEPINGNNLDFKADLRAINLAAFEGLTKGNIKESKGFITGLLDIKGTTDAPKIDGYLETKDLSTKITMINNRFLFPKERIGFSNGVISFDKFRIIDTTSNMAVLNGTATTRDYKNYDLNLNLSADRWLLMNSTARDYESMYGRVIMSSDINVNGTATAPNVSGNVIIHDSTNFTYAQTDAGPGTVDHKGIVVFVNSLDSVQHSFDTSLAGVRDRVENAMQLNLNLETEKHALFNVIVDPLSGDNLQVGGAAYLNANLTPSGRLALAGTYIIENGFYELNINFLRRKFEILEGSTIMLSGDPLDAEVNIKAGYDAVISPYDLVSNQVQDPTQLVYYKQRLPFQVVLHITGKPLQPNIKFDITIPEDGTQTVSKDVANVVETKLRLMRADVAEMNKQVFAILVAGRFVGENPFESGASTSMEFYARQSASRFISQQMNKLTSNLINGVDLALDLQSSEDYSSGAKENRTDLSVKASKKLLDDRLTVTLGNDFQLEGRQLPGRESALIPGNIRLDYRLVKDGRYSVNAFRKNQLQNIIDGFVVETGAGFRLNYEYNKFSQLFDIRRGNREVRSINRKVDDAQQQRADTTNATNGPIVFVR